MSYSRSILNIDYLTVSLNKIVYTRGENIYIDGEKIFFIEGNYPVMEINVISDEVQYIILTNGNGYIVTHDNTLSKLPYSCYKGITAEEIIVYEFNYELLTQENYIYNTISFERKKIETHGGIIYYFDDSLVEIKSGKTLFFNKPILKTLWSFSILNYPVYKHSLKLETVEPEIEQIVGINNNIIWLLLGDCTLLGVDTDTGKLKHKVKSRLFLRDKVNHIDHKNNMIKTLSGNYYYELNLKTLKTVEYKVTSNFSFFKSNFYEGDKYLYFCAFKNNINNPNSFGLFNTETKEIVWHKECETKEISYYKPPQANREHIAILDSNKTLTIYDKKDIITKQ